MAVEFKLPDLGENIEGGDVVKVLVGVGEEVDEDQSIIELETDKAVIEVPSSVRGTITALHVKEGDHVTVGQSLLSVEGEARAEREGSAAVAPPPAPLPGPATTTPVQPSEPELPDSKRSSEAVVPASGTLVFVLPDLGENIEGGDVVKVLVGVGEEVDEDQSIIELETDKAVIEVPSSVRGTIAALHVKEGDRVTVGQDILTVAGGASEVPIPEEKPAPAPAPISEERSAPLPVSSPMSATLVAAAPSIRRLAREIGIDITQVAGSGPGGRISEDDVKAHARQLNTAREAPSAAALAAPKVDLPLPDFAQWGEVQREPMSNVRRITAERLSYAWTTIPHVTQFDKADTTDLEGWRKQFAKKAEAAGGKLTPTAIILKVVAAALKAFPQFNASIDMADREVIYKKYCHIGVAVDTDRGLLVPVVRDVDQKNIIELAVELGEIAQKARDRKLAPEDMQGGCFTISNLGGIGGTGFAPIVNPPEVAILGVARGAYEPVFSEGEFVPRLIMPLSLSYDHRLIDGAEGARFLRWICEALENPFLLVLEG